MPSKTVGAVPYRNKHEDADEKGFCLIAYADGELHRAVDAVSEGGLYSINDNVVSRNLSRLKT